MNLQKNVLLAAKTTLGVGGPACFFSPADTPETLGCLLRHGHLCAWPIFILGEGSNVLVADEGYAGLVIQLAFQDISIVEDSADGCRLRAEAGASWDHLVHFAVQRNLAGIECLSGIPGQVGAAPVQNIGAYGQELAETLRTVHAVHRETGEGRAFSRDECGFAYRHSHFKGAWAGQYVITAVELQLHKAGPPALRYPELMQTLSHVSHPSLQQTRDAVLEIRRKKSMVLDPTDPNSKSAGSFFTNPIVSEDTADAVLLRAQRRGLDSMPQFPTGSGKTKLSAAWLIEAAGMGRGYHRGRVGLSTNHCLAVINRGGATAAEIVEFALHVRDNVHRAFGVLLTPEPQLVGFPREVRRTLHPSD